MRLGIMADSHDHVPNVHRAVETFNRHEVDLVLHAGDFVAPFAVRPFSGLRCGMVAVFGNNDGERIGLQRAFDQFGGRVEPNLATLEVGERRLALTHYPEIAEPLAAGGGFDLVVFGHTHEIAERRPGSTLLLNPGEVGGWLTGRATVAVVDLATMAAAIEDLAAD